MRKLQPVTPGELLREEFLIPMGLSQYRLAKEIRVPAQRISEIVTGKRSITADTDLRLCRFLGLSNGYWFKSPGGLRYRSGGRISLQSADENQAMEEIACRCLACSPTAARRSAVSA